MVKDHSIQATEGIDSSVDNLLGKGEISQISGHKFDLCGILFLELLEGLRTTSYYHHPVRLGEEILCHSKADA